MGDWMVCISAILACWVTLTSAQLNILVVMDEGNSQANQGLDSALKYLESESPSAVNAKSEIYLKKGMHPQILEDVCSQLDTMIEEGSPPDLVLDLSHKGEMVKSISRNLGLPTVTSSLGAETDLRTWSDLTSEQEGYLVQVRSPADILPNIIRDLVTLTNINTAAVLYDDTFVLDKHLNKLFVNLPVRHIYIKLGQDDISTEALLEDLVRNMKINNFIILASPDMVNETLTLAESKMFDGPSRTWLAGSLEDLSDVTGDCCDNMRIITFNPSLSSYQALTDKFSAGEEKMTIQSVFYAELVTRAVQTVMKLKQEGSWPSLEYTKCSAYNGEPIIRVNDIKSKLSGLAGPSLSISSNGLSQLMFRVEVSLRQPGDQRNDVGTWAHGVGLDFNSGMEGRLDTNPKREKYKIVTVHQPPFMYYNEDTDSFEGLVFDLLEEIKDMLGFDYELSLASDDKYGRAGEENDNWDGMMGDLVSNAADIGIGAIHVTAQRQMAVDFTAPFYEPVGWSIMMKKEKPPNNVFKFIWIMQSVIWVIIFTAYFAVISLMWYFNIISPFSYRNNKEDMKDDPEIRYFTWKESIYFGFMTFTPQGAGLVPKAYGAKWVAASWWLFCFITIASYAANYGANLTIGRMVKRKERFDELIMQKVIKWAPLKESDPLDFFEAMKVVEHTFYHKWKAMALTSKITEAERTKLATWTYPVSTTFTHLWADVNNNEDFVYPADMDEVVFKVVNGSRKAKNQFAFIGDATDIRYLELTNCDVEETGDQEFMSRPYAFAVRKGKPGLRDALSNAILKLTSMRRMDSLKIKWWKNNPYQEECEVIEETGKFDLEDIGGIFILAGVGVIMSVLLLIVEYAYFKYKERKISVKPEILDVQEAEKTAN